MTYLQFEPCEVLQKIQFNEVRCFFDEQGDAAINASLILGGGPRSTSLLGVAVTHC